MMISNNEEFFGQLEEIACNVGLHLYDWDVKDVDKLIHLASRVRETAVEVSCDLHAQAKWGNEEEEDNADNLSE